MSKAAARLAWICALAALGASVSVGCNRSQGPEPAPASATVASASSATPAAATESQRAEFKRWFAAQPHLALNVPAEGAKVLILKFNDFQCPPCAQSHTAIKPIIDKYRTEHPGEVRYVMVDYPLDSECNPYVALGGPHPAACEAAAAVRLAWGHDHAEAMIDWLFANQAQLTPASVRQAAREVGQIADFDAQYPSTLERIQGDVELGHRLEVKQTPTFFVNGVRLEGGFSPDYIEEAIKYELQAASK
jgi:protein-disulfide isomerase